MALTEAAQVLDLLVERMVRAGFRMSGIGDDTVGSGYLYVSVHASAGEIMVFLRVGAQGEAEQALTFLIPDNLHLNGWRRPTGDYPAQALTDSLWAKFWVDDVENGMLKRCTWMGGHEFLPTSAVPTTPLPVGVGGVFELFGEDR